jgi:hypothetical protein
MHARIRRNCGRKSGMMLEISTIIFKKEKIRKEERVELQGIGFLFLNKLKRFYYM